MNERKKKIVVYFSKEKETDDPFFEFGEKKDVWHELFRRAEKAGLEMYVSGGEESYFSNYIFGNTLKYQKGVFISQAGKIKADAVYDRSASDFFPKAEISHKVLNGREFKDLCWNKKLTYELLGDFMPKSVEISSSKDLKAKLKQFKQSDLVVLKPAKDLGGNGVRIDYPNNMKNIKIKRNHLLQEFVDTSFGIKGIIKGKHDLRIVIANGKMVLAHVRTPKEGSLLANVAQGGNIKEVSLKKIPEYIMQRISAVQNIIDARFDKPVYSIDLGVYQCKPYIFELNSHIGFPRKDMYNCGNFIEAIIESLAIRSKH